MNLSIKIQNNPKSKRYYCLHKEDIDVWAGDITCQAHTQVVKG